MNSLEYKYINGYNNKYYNNYFTFDKAKQFTKKFITSVYD